MDNQPTTGQVPDSNGLTPVVSPAAPEGQAPPAPKTFDEQYVKDLRAEAAKARTEKADLEKRLKAIEDAQLTDAEKKQKRLEELELADTQKEARIQELTKLGALKDAAQAAGMANTKALRRLADLEAVELGPDGEPTEASLKAAVATLKADYPELFGATSTLPSSGGATSPGRSVGQIPAFDVNNRNRYAGVTFKD